MTAGELSVTEIDPELRIIRSKQTPGLWVWYCNHQECWSREAHGQEWSREAAELAIRTHAFTDCPPYARMTDRLMASVQAVPEFKVATFKERPGAAFCLRCEVLVFDRLTHIDEHVEAVNHG